MSFILTINESNGYLMHDEDECTENDAHDSDTSNYERIGNHDSNWLERTA